MSYSDFGPYRRSRRRRNIIILILVMVVIGVLVLAVRYRTERRESIDYLTVAIEMGREHGDMSDQLGALLQGLGGENRPALELRLQTLADKALELSMTLDEQVVPRPVAEVSGLMGVAASSWADGIGALGDAIVDILDAEENDVSADETLRRAFNLIRVGDRAYGRALEALAEIEPELIPAEFPVVSYTLGDYGPLYNAPVVAERLRQQGALAELVDVTLTMTTQPEPVSDNDTGIWAIPASDSLSLQVTVSNTGNVVAENITVLVTLQRVGSAEALDPASQLIPSIEPGQSELRVFENIAAEPGAVYSITASATVEGVEDPTDDNMRNLVFERNAE